MVHSESKKRPNEYGNKGGRPRKKHRLSVNSGRKRVSVAHTSKSTLRRRTLEISDALKKIRCTSTQSTESVDSSQSTESVDSPQSTQNTECFESILNDCNVNFYKKKRKQMFMPPKNHTKESALAFYLDNDYSKENIAIW